MSVEYVGPFERWAVVVDGREVPLLTMRPYPGGRVALSLDGRFGLDLTVDEAERVIPFLAHAIAMAAGYASHPSASDEPVALPAMEARRVTRLDWFDRSGPGAGQ